MREALNISQNWNYVNVYKICKFDKQIIIYSFRYAAHFTQSYLIESVSEITRYL